MMLQLCLVGYLHAQLSVDSAIWLVVLGLNYWATSRIIRQAGYSIGWIALPLVPLVLTIWVSLVAGGQWNTLLLGFAVSFLGGTNTVVTVLRVDELSIVVCWLFFLVFAFVRWPVSEGRGQSKVAASPRQSSKAKCPASAPTPLRESGELATQTAGSATQGLPSRSGPVPGVASAGQRKFLYCGWCGEATPGNRALSHNCGDDQRALAYCRVCGKPFVSGADSCAECDR